MLYKNIQVQYVNKEFVYITGLNSIFKHMNNITFEFNESVNGHIVQRQAKNTRTQYLLVTLEIITYQN